MSGERSRRRNGVFHLDWEDQALCLGLDTEEFYREKARPPKQYLALCVGCPVRVDCLDYALRLEAGMSATTRYGYWGGLSPTERARYRDTDALLRALGE